MLGLSAMEKSRVGKQKWNTGRILDDDCRMKFMDKAVLSDAA